MADDPKPGGMLSHVQARADIGGSKVSAYEADVLAWSEQQSALLRRIGAGEAVNGQVDWENVAEEIESVGQYERRTLVSHVRTVIEHLAKLQASPALEPRAGWQDTVMRVRLEIEDLLDTSPSLRPTLEAVIARQQPRALKLVASAMALHGETPRVPLNRISFTSDQVLSDWFPQPPD